METHGLLILSGTCNLLYSQCSALSTVAFISVFFFVCFPAEVLCMALLCCSYCESKYAFHWNHCMYCVDSSHWKELMLLRPESERVCNVLSSLREIQIPSILRLLGKRCCGEKC